jgi:HAD domain in Swiss Army Knife RNA repair proteins
LVGCDIDDSAVTRPLLLLDVDGVLNPLGVRDAPGFVPYHLGGVGVLLSPDHGRWLTSLADVFDLTWATSWERDADLIAERIGLPRGLPVVTFTDQYEWMVKLPDVVRYVGDRACAWVDDQLGPDVRTWADTRQAPTLLVETDSRVGLTLEHVERMRRFATDLRAAQARW